VKKFIFGFLLILAPNWIASAAAVSVNCKSFPLIPTPPTTRCSSEYNNYFDRARVCPCQQSSAGGDGPQMPANCNGCINAAKAYHACVNPKATPDPLVLSEECGWIYN
jgi:hypothetical protein